MSDRNDQGVDVDPQEFLRRMLHISPEDAEKVREATPGTRKGEQAADPCSEAKYRLIAAEEALQAFTTTEPLVPGVASPEWDEATQAAYMAAYREWESAKEAVKRSCGNGSLAV